MTDKLMVDYRNPAQHRVIYLPYWISSLEIKALDLGSDETKIAVCFSFPAAKYGDSIIIVEKVGFQVTEAWAGGTITIDAGRCTIPLESTAAGGAVTFVDENDLIETSGITSGTEGYYPAAAGDWITAAALATCGADCRIVPADSTVPCVTVYVTSDGTMTAGKGRLHMMITEVPLY